MREHDYAGRGVHSTNRAELIETWLIETWLDEERQRFTGWDFSYLDGRLLGEREPWSYMGRAGEFMRRASSVIDLDTGGGEKLLGLREHWPARVVATEDYPPNFELASERLSPLSRRGREGLRSPIPGPCPSATVSSISC